MSATKATTATSSHVPSTCDLSPRGKCPVAWRIPCSGRAYLATDKRRDRERESENLSRRTEPRPWSPAVFWDAPLRRRPSHAPLPLYLSLSPQPSPWPPPPRIATPALIPPPLRPDLTLPIRLRCLFSQVLTLFLISLPGFMFPSSIRFYCTVDFVSNRPISE